MAQDFFESSLEDAELNEELVTLAMDTMASIRVLLIVVDGFAVPRMLVDTLMESVDQMWERSKKDTDSISFHVMSLLLFRCRCWPRPTPTAQSTRSRSRIAWRIIGRSGRTSSRTRESRRAAHDSASLRDIESDSRLERPIAEEHPPTIVHRLEEDHCRPRGGCQQHRLPQQCSQRRHDATKVDISEAIRFLNLAKRAWPLNELLVTLTTGLRAVHAKSNQMNKTSALDVAAKEFLDALRKNATTSRLQHRRCEGDVALPVGRLAS